MINRQLRNVELITYGGTDEYGQMLTTSLGSKNILMTFGIYTHSHVEDIRYTDVTHFGLTKEKVNDKQTIKVDNQEYKILFVNPHKMWNEVLLRLK